MSNQSPKPVEEYPSDPNDLIPPYDTLKRLDPLFQPRAKAYKVNYQMTIKKENFSG